MHISRRDFFRAAMATGVAFACPSILNAAGAAATPGSWDRYLILVQLSGGNDGLNTLIPVDQRSEYIAARPQLALSGADIKTISGITDFDFHASLINGAGSGRFESIYGDGQMAIVQGVGLPDPNRSHFRGRDIWDAGSDSNVVDTTGWLQRSFAAEAAASGAPPASIVAEASLLSYPNSNPVMGGGARALSMSTPESFVRDSQSLLVPSAAGATAAMQHVLSVQTDVTNARGQFENKFAWDPNQSDRADQITLPQFARDGDASNPLFPEGSFGRQCRAAAEMITVGVGVPVIKLNLGGFDTHSGQLTSHANLLDQLAHGLTGLRDALVEKSLMDKALIMTFSEFGRRVNENGSAGTDHGTAAPHFIIGDSSNINGGVYGSYPSLTDLDSRGDLKYSQDYRSMQATALNFMGLPQNVFSAAYAPVSGLLT